MKNQMRIILGVTGGIAAYKAVELARLLVKSGHSVKVIMTEHAKAFIHPNTFAAITGHAVYDDLFDTNQIMVHIELAKWAEYLIIAPTTANTMAKIAHGMADNLLLNVILATEARVLIAPAMNKIMWENRLTQENFRKLITVGYQIIDPASGEQACGDVGVGRMAEPFDIFKKLEDLIKKQYEISSLKDKCIVITAGPTEEPIDPVRFISNRSSGKMGYALAHALKNAGAKVTLISGPVSLSVPEVDLFIDVKNAEEMHQNVLDHVIGCDLFIAAAAVSDYRVKEPKQQKIKKVSSEDTITLELVKNPDILASVGHLAENERPSYVIGFALETDNLLEHAKNKLINKNADLIIANAAKSTGEPFNSDDNELTLCYRCGKVNQFQLASKEFLAFQITRLIADLFDPKPELETIQEKQKREKQEQQECLDLCQVF